MKNSRKVKDQLSVYRFVGDGFILRPFRPGDAPDIAKHANNSRIAANLRDVFPHPYSLKDAKAFISFVAAEPNNLVLAIEVDGEACGAIGLHGMTDIYRFNAEIGYWLSEKYWGRGIMSKAVTEMVRTGFTKFHWTRIWAGVFYFNTASARVLEKCGFRREAVHRGAVTKNGNTFDEFIYALLKDEWSGRE
ncbi:MAG: GNAT family N-acetyltransferase [Bacteroidota bacterium]